MRWTIAALMAGTFLLAGCQDSEARQQIAQLKEENAKLKDKPDALTQLLALKATEGGGDGTDRKINTLSEDLRAGIESLKREFSATNKRVDDMDDRMRKIAALDATITALKGSIDSLDSRVKSSSPEEMLKLQKEVLQKDAALTQEKLAREAADARATQLQGDLKAALEAAQKLRDDMAGMESADISKHPAYVKAQKEIRDLKTRIEQMEGDIRNLDEKGARLEEENKRLRGDSPKVENPRIDPKAYDFTGTVTDYKTADRPGSLGNILVRIDSGQVPPDGSILTILNARAEPICTAKVSLKFHIDEDPKKAVEWLGCPVTEEKSTRLPTVGDTAVWVKPADDKSAKAPDPKGEGTAGGK